MVNSVVGGFFDGMTAESGFLAGLLLVFGLYAEFIWTWKLAELFGKGVTFLCGKLWEKITKRKEVKE